MPSSAATRVAVVVVVVMTTGLSACSGSGDDGPPVRQATAIDNGSGGGSESVDLGRDDTASAATPDFFLVVVADGCGVQRLVVPPSARIGGLQWQVEGADGEVRRLPARRAIYRESRPGRWRVSLTLGRGASLRQVAEPETARC